jgi:hypothetical protein
LSIQESFEKSQQRTNSTSASDGGSTSSQFQVLSAISKEVNRRLGLNEDSTVGKSVAAAASVGAKIPLTQIGAEVKAEGRSVDQQRLLSAQDYARKAAESAQISDATTLVKDFRASDAYQWARSNRATSAAGYESSSREAGEKQSSSDIAYGRAKELARTAQFMREWSSGTQTDFTNYAAQRLADRGLLREEDPIKLQRAVTEIAYSYARGGNAASGYVPNDSPLDPSQPLPEAMGWQSSLRDQYEHQVRDGKINPIIEQSRYNDAEIQARQSSARVGLSETVENDVSGLLKQGKRDVVSSIATGRSQVSEESSALSENYRSSVRVGKISPNHGGNQAVWDTVGANADVPKIGKPQKQAPVGE